MVQQRKFTNDWDKERKKQKVLSLIFIAVLVIVAVLIAISLLRRSTPNATTTLPGTAKSGLKALL